MNVFHSLISYLIKWILPSFIPHCQRKEGKKLIKTCFALLSAYAGGFSMWKLLFIDPLTVTLILIKRLGKIFPLLRKPFRHVADCLDNPKPSTEWIKSDSVNLLVERATEMAPFVWRAFVGRLFADFHRLWIQCSRLSRWNLFKLHPARNIFPVDGCETNMWKYGRKRFFIFSAYAYK